MHNAAGQDLEKSRYCDACFTGVYPLGVPKDFKGTAK
jgi:hypothetical protein